MTNKCRCLEYSNASSQDFMGMGVIILKEEGKRVRECQYSMTLPCYCVDCTQCPEHKVILND